MSSHVTIMIHEGDSDDKQFADKLRAYIATQRGKTTVRIAFYPQGVWEANTGHENGYLKSATRGAVRNPGFRKFASMIAKGDHHFCMSDNLWRFVMVTVDGETIHLAKSYYTPEYLDYGTMDKTAFLDLLPKPIRGCRYIFAVDQILEFFLHKQFDYALLPAEEVYAKLGWDGSWPPGS